MFIVYGLLGFLGLVLLYVVGRPLIPKGFLFQEIISLPHFWWQVWRSKTDQMKVEKKYYGPHRRQYLLCCEPVSQKTNVDEVVVYYHGGGWMLGTPEQFKPNAQFFVERGYTVFMPSYRRTPRFAYPQIDEDLESTLRFIQELKEEKGLGSAKILLSGMSAGGNIVALLAYDRQRLARLNWQQNYFSRILLFGAPLDLEGMKASLPLHWYAGKRDSAQFQQASPRFHLQEEEHLPLCCVHGEKDGMVPLAAAHGFIQHLQPRQKGPLQYEVLKNGSHLDSGSWVYATNEVRAIVVDWLAKSK